MVTNGKMCRIVVAVLTAVILMSGCNSQKTSVEKMYDVLENVVSSEKGFEQQQDPLVTLEKKEKSLYDQIIGLGMKEYDQIVKLSNEALNVADERKVRMDRETKSIEESRKKFKEAENLKDHFDKQVLNKKANELYDVMMQRYQAHNQLYKDYMDGIESDKELYKMFKNKNLPLSDLEDQVNKLNKIYEKIYADNQQFNKLTEEYNSKKLSFYKAAGLKSK